MVAFLEKTDGSEGFHQIVDFLNASHIRFALSENPTIYDSHIKQFWQTATVNTLDNGEQEITTIVDGHVKTVTIASVRKYLQLEVEIPQSNFPTQTPVTDEAAFIGVDVVYGGATTTVSSIDAGQGSGNITKSPTMPHDSPLLGGHKPGSDEGSMTLHELTVLCTNLSNKVESLETELKQTKQTYGTAFTKLIKKVKKLEQTVKTSQARRRTNIIAFDDEEDLVVEDPSKHGRSMIEEMDLDAGISLVPPNVEVKGSTTSPQRHANTTTNDLTLAETLMEIRKSATKAKGKAKMDETESLRKMKQREQLQAGEKCSEEDLPMKLVKLVNQRKKFFAQQRAEAKRNKPMTLAQQKEYMSNYVKNQEGGEEFAEKEKELSEEELQKLLVIVPLEEVYVEVLHVKYPIIYWEVYSVDTRRYWKIIRVGNHTEAYPTFAEMLKKFDRDDLVKLWDLVKERFSTIEPTNDKEKELERLSVVKRSSDVDVGYQAVSRLTFRDDK
ncbi:hypothetical protein Tco_1161468 [Tanacetum coccineum]